MSLASILDAGLMVLQPEVLIVILVSSAFGLMVGAIPGLTATMAIALVVPATFFMSPLSAVAAIVATSAMAISAGDIPGALLRIPGTPASAAYTDEAFAMTRKGLANQALGASLFCAASGGLAGSVLLLIAGPILSRWALQFSAFEFFWLALLGLSTAALISSGDSIKGAMSVTIGIGISMVGLDVMSGHPRFAFGSPELMGGVSFIPAMIGMFALSQMLHEILGDKTVKTAPVSFTGHPFQGLFANLRRYKINMLRGASLGAVIGALPGAGGDIAAWIAYGMARRFSKTPEKFGTGHVEGIVEAGSANNSGLSSAWIPGLFFGVPGDAITAIAIGVLFMKGLTPGPHLFRDQPTMFAAIVLIFFVANILLIPLGFLTIGLFRYILRIPRRVISPIILVFCIVGSFAIENSTYGVTVMLVMGIVAYILENNGFPIAPIILGLVIGPILERNFMMSVMISDGSVVAFFERPISLVLGIITLAVWGLPLLRWFWSLQKRSSETAHPGT